MQHLRLILHPGERVTYRGAIHPVVYVPGLLMLGLSVAAMMYLPTLAHLTPAIENLAYTAQDYWRGFRYTHALVAGLLFLRGVSSLVNAMVLVYSTELLVTDRRVLVKTGVTTTTTMEIDRRKIASVLVKQTIPGRMFNYGWVVIQGISGSISGLPVLAHPNRLQQQLYA